MKRCTLSSQAVFGLALFFWALQTQAGGFSVQPVRVHLSPDQPTASLSVRNTGDAEAVVQISAHLWGQEAGADILQATRDVLVTPPISRIAPGQSQLVRLGLRSDFPVLSERTYRLVLSEIPGPAAAGFTGLRMSLQVSMPVFVLPAVAVAPTLEWTAELDESNDLWVVLTNSGTAHVQIKKIALARHGGEVRGLPGAAGYVLPGQRRKWKLEGIALESDSLLLQADTDAGGFEASINIPPVLNVSGQLARE